MPNSSEVYVIYKCGFTNTEHRIRNHLVLLTDFPVLLFILLHNYY